MHGGASHLTNMRAMSKQRGLTDNFIGKHDTKIPECRNGLFGGERYALVKMYENTVQTPGYYTLKYAYHS